MKFIQICGSLLLSVNLAADAPPAVKQPDMNRKNSIELLDAALSDAKTAPEPSKRLAILQQAAKKVRNNHPANVMISDWLAPLDDASSPSVAELLESLEKTRDLLSFEPTMEAPLPNGFPNVTPVGEIQIKRYPEYRLARTPASASETVAFFTLFGHIQSQGIAMTAPVEMTFSAGREGGPKEESMAFLYRSTEQGQLGKGGLVDVVDVPALSTVSIGLPGAFNPQRVAEAQKRLEAWLAEQQQWTPAGPLRVLGYNGPNVPAKKRYFEVEIPVQKKESASG